MPKEVLLKVQRVWYSIKDASFEKDIPYRTLLSKPWLRPNAGKPDGIVSGKMVWKAETIKKWLFQTDDELLALYEKNKSKENEG
jgi:hypothetical protein